MKIGLLDWFNKEKGFGVLKTSEGMEFFFHLSNWKDQTDFVVFNKTPIVFEEAIRRNKYSAINCCFFDVENLTHWDLFFSLHDYIVYSNKRYLNLIESIILNLDDTFDFSILDGFLRKITDKNSDAAFVKGDNQILDLYERTRSHKLKLIIEKKIFSRVRKMKDDEILTFWQSTIVPEFIPSKETLINISIKLTYDDLLRIHCQETLGLIILRKIDHLKQNFKPDQFIGFQLYIDLISSEKLVQKLVKDLNRLALLLFVPHVYHQFNLLSVDDKLYTKDISDLYKTLPPFITKNIVDFLELKVREVVERYGSFRLLVDCWETETIEGLSDILLQRVEDQSEEDLLYLLNFKKCNGTIWSKVIDQLIDNEAYEVVLKNVDKQGDECVFEKYDKEVFSRAESECYFNLWKDKIGKITPQKFLSTYFNEDSSRYLDTSIWVTNGLLTIDEISQLLFDNVRRLDSIDNRREFYTVYYSVNALLDLNLENVSVLSAENNQFVDLILWHLKQINVFDFDYLKGKFIFFKPEEQVYIFKRLFYLKHKGIIDFDLDRLDEIVRADIDLYLTNNKINDDFVLDISTHILIEAIKAFVNTGSFVFESDLILKDLRNNSKRKFKIDQYFDCCDGRMEAIWDWNTNGSVSQIPYGGGKYYFAISINKTKDKTLFDELLNAVKCIPQSRWNAKLKHWGVMSCYYSEVYAFAQKYNFFIKLSDNEHYKNNTHLAILQRTVKPEGVEFCEGRKAKKKHSIFQNDFWYCVGQDCFLNCVVDHLSDKVKNDDLERDEWERYTLLDFLRILEINVDEDNGFDLLKDGHYHKFLGHINAFNRLLEHLYCKDCGNLLYPVKASHFALYRDVRFHCVEKGCSQYQKEIYLNHCLYGECKSIIDSRISKQCEYGLYICPNCGTCCSKEFFKRKLGTLTKVGGYIHPKLRENVENNNGHLEEKKYFCYKCAEPMFEKEKNMMHCNNCNVTYELDKFKWLFRKWEKVI